MCGSLSVSSGICFYVPPSFYNGVPFLFFHPGPKAPEMLLSLAPRLQMLTLLRLVFTWLLGIWTLCSKCFYPVPWGVLLLAWCDDFWKTWLSRLQRSLLGMYISQRMLIHSASCSNQRGRRFSFLIAVDQDVRNGQGGTLSLSRWFACLLKSLEHKIIASFPMRRVRAAVFHLDIDLRKVSSYFLGDLTLCTCLSFKIEWSGASEGSNGFWAPYRFVCLNTWCPTGSAVEGVMEPGES